MDYLLMDKRGKHPTAIGRHYSFKLQLDHQCPKFPSHQDSDTLIKAKVVLTTSLFHDANLNYADVGQLLSVWQDEGLFSTIARCCPTCLSTFNQLNSQRGREPSEDNEVTHIEIDPSSDVPRFYQRSRLDFTSNPMNIYFHLSGVAGLTKDDQEKFMGDMQWPESITINKVEYQIVSRGFWGHNHYWAKVVRHVDGARGVWFYDDRRDDGRAQLLGRELSRQPKAIDRDIARIIQKNPDSFGDVPFVSAAVVDGDDDHQIEVSQVAEVPPVEPTSGNFLTGAEMASDARQVFASTCPPVVGVPIGEVSLHAPSRALLQGSKPKHVSNGADADERDILAKEAFKHFPSSTKVDEAPKTHNKQLDPVKDSVTLRLWIKRPAPDSSPIKSLSPSPQKELVNRKTSRGKKGLGKQAPPMLELGVVVKKEPGLKEESNKAKAKGKKKKY
ncbi:uncharacterized protein MELLADRAFT_84650 [Melampsora larici-populina 98AG31]|uniref:Uncharacterized protein n=1 Tax=Melampsora larici-populina (strain 98AG31 / pathotype 3-4-7) TaxID=747676 RepID=F4RG14_MELLP|nr:uncharacterized protein MELLADRAFT_84650 [Melampsora larici-populina 98AG31]EGG08472.1 hypothetical protein MELLADRAFT_84650 [Melampsora larici-populina 98AG31]